MDEQDERRISRLPKQLLNCLENEDKKGAFIDEVKFCYEDVLVYRGISEVDKISKNDFLGNVETNQLKRKKPRYKINDYRNHGVSVNENLQELKKALKFPNSNIHGVACGKMRCCYGPADFKQGKHHHNWYLFDGANASVANEFRVLDIVSGKEEHK